MTIVNVVFVSAAEPGKSLDQHRAVPNLQAFDLDMDINFFTNQSAGN
jgi:hypothetical protein